MSKDFEKEYRQMIDAEIPDLWDRIEARLPEREVSAVPVTKTTKVVTGKFLNRRYMSLAAAAAAAVICILAVRPMFATYKYSESARPQSAQSPNMGAMSGPASDGASYDSANTDHVDSNDIFDKWSNVFQGVSGDAESNKHLAADRAPEANSGAQFAEVAENANDCQNDLFAQENTETSDQPTEAELEEARAAAKEYYRNTVFELRGLEVKTATENRIVFTAICTRDGKAVDPDRTVEVTFDGEQWTVTNEGY